MLILVAKEIEGMTTSLVERRGERVKREEFHRKFSQERLFTDVSPLFLPPKNDGVFNTICSGSRHIGSCQL